MNCPSCGRVNREDAAYCDACGIQLVRQCAFDEGKAPTGAPDNLSPAPDGMARGDFVGRHREMAELKAALDGALSGWGRLVMLVGEPGIGKTRTAEGLAAAARQRGAQVLWGLCPEERGAPPYWPWTQAIRSYLLEQEPGALEAHLGDSASDVAQIVPEIQLSLPALAPAAPVEDPEQARFRLFHSIAAFFRRVSQKQPLMLVLDNLHWADPTSLRLLEFVAPELAASRVLLLGAYRDVDVSRGHPLFRTLGELTRQRLYQRILLRGLNRDEVGQVMGAVGEAPLPPELVTTVHQQTGGNPLFVREVARLLAEEGLLKPERLGDLKNWDFRLPDGVREVIGRRLDRLSERCNQALTVASVIGREFSSALLAHIMREPLEKLLEALEEAQTARIIEENPASVGGNQFSHALIQQTLVSELSTTRRVRLHAQIAAALEALYGANSAAHAAELAYHYGQAESLLGPGPLVRYSLLAGEKALAAYAYEEALSQFQTGLAAKENAGAGPGAPPPVAGGKLDAETAALLFGLGRAQAFTNQVEEALTSLAQAFDYYVGAGDVERVVAIAGYPYTGLLTGLMAEQRRRALSLLPSDSRDAGRMLAAYGLSLGASGDYELARQTFTQALTIARRERDAALEIGALANAARVEGTNLRWQACLSNSLQAINLAAAVDDPISKLRAHGWAASSLLQFGKPDEARRRSEAMLEISEKVCDPAWLVNAYILAMALARLTGNFSVAREFSDRALAIGPRHALTLAWRAQLEHEMGERSQGERYLDELLDVLRTARPRPLENFLAAFAVPAAARSSGNLAHFDVARGAAQTVLAEASATPEQILWARLGLGLLAAQSGDLETAAAQYAYLQKSPGLLSRAGSPTIPRVLGLLAETLGQPGLAEEHYQASLAACRRAGYRPELAWVCYDYAALLDKCSQPQRASALLSEAQAIAAELGMRPLQQRVCQLEKSIKPQPGKGPARPTGLTLRQTQVLRLIADGKTNREIASELVLSERTVERHVAEIYDKIGVRNRAEATAFALSRLLSAE